MPEVDGQNVLHGEILPYQRGANCRVVLVVSVTLESQWDLPQLLCHAIQCKEWASQGQLAVFCTGQRVVGYSCCSGSALSPWIVQRD